MSPGLPSIVKLAEALMRDLEFAVSRFPRRHASTSSNQQFTLQELDFILTEMYASITNGAEHPLFTRVYEKCKVIAKALKSLPVETSRCIHGRVVCEPCAQMAVRFHEKTIALAKEIYARHDRINKLLYSGAPGIMLGPMDSDAAHADRGALLSMLTPAQRGAVEPPRELSASEAASFEKAFADSPRRVEPKDAQRWKHQWVKAKGFYTCVRCNTTSLEAHDAALCPTSPVNGKPEHE